MCSWPIWANLGQPLKKREEFFMNAVIRALEVGFGTTSLVKDVVDGQPQLMTFPSLVSQVDKNKSSINAGINKRNTVTVDVDGL